MRRMQHKVSKDDPRKGTHLFPVILILLGLLLLTGTGFWIRDRFFATGSLLADPVADPGPRVMMNGEILGTGHRPMVRNGQVWLQIGTVREHLDPYVWFDEDDERITFTTGTRIIRMHAGSKEALDGKRALILSSEPVLVNGTVWLPAGFLSDFYGLDVRLMSFNGNVRVDSKTRTPEAAGIPSWKPVKGKLSLAWEMMYAPNNRYLDRKFSEGLDVLAPTWFSITDAQDNIAVRADKGYIKSAHGNGYEVWALFANRFDDIEGTSKMMHNPERRQAVIEEMLVHAKQFGLDGINLDFENIFREDSGHYTQFVREFAATFRPEGLVVSVDISVPGGSDTWSRCFDRKALAESADCIFLMAYDQHYVSSAESGSTAEIGWVEAMVQATLEEVPAEKLLLGIPLFSRVWREADAAGNADVSVVNALGVNTAWQRARENGSEPVWDKESGQYVARFSNEEGAFAIWLEDWNAVNIKTSLVLKYGLAGAGAWSINYADDRNWEVIGRNLKETADYDSWLASWGPAPRFKPLTGE